MQVSKIYMYRNVKILKKYCIICIKHIKIVKTKLKKD